MASRHVMYSREITCRDENITMEHRRSIPTITVRNKLHREEPRSQPPCEVRPANVGWQFYPPELIGWRLHRIAHLVVYLLPRSFANTIRLTSSSYLGLVNSKQRQWLEIVQPNNKSDGNDNDNDTLKEVHPTIVSGLALEA